MAIDYAALLGATGGLRLAKYKWNFATDFTTVGVHGLAGTPIPVGGVIVGAWIFFDTGLVQAADPTNKIFTEEADPICTFSQSISGAAEILAWNNLYPATAPRTPQLEIVTNVITAGSFTLWLAYLEL